MLLATWCVDWQNIICVITRKPMSPFVCMLVVHIYSVLMSCYCMFLLANNFEFCRRKLKCYQKTFVNILNSCCACTNTSDHPALIVNYPPFQLSRTIPIRIGQVTHRRTHLFTHRTSSWLSSANIVGPTASISLLSRYLCKSIHLIIISIDSITLDLFCDFCQLAAPLPVATLFFFLLDLYSFYTTTSGHK